KQLDDRTIYLSRNNYGPLARPTGTIQLVDFDLAVHSKPGELHYGAIQGEIYLAPEVIIDSGYSYSADIWSLGVILWDLLEKQSLFNPVTLGDGKEYDDLTHLGQITALLGPAPQDLLTKGRRSTLFYQEDDMEFCQINQFKYNVCTSDISEWRAATLDTPDYP
ncbi:hypothetical protein FOXB_06009, partial [Fusarium oxysporum f. sp. conglutinans Fo5176]